MLKVAIATSTSDKIFGVKDAFFRFFNVKENDVEFYSKSTNSDVPEQPFNEETYAGALNRIHGIEKEFPDMDFYVSCEAGIESAYGQHFNVQVVCIKSKEQMLLWGKSAGWSIPHGDIKKIKKNNLDTYLKEKGINNIEELLGPSNSRRAAVAQATGFALASRRLKLKN